MEASERIDKSPEALMETIGTVRVTVGQEGAHEDTRDAYHALVLKQGAPLAQASLDALQR